MRSENPDPFAAGSVVSELKLIAKDAGLVWYKRAAAVLSIAQIAQMKHCCRSNRAATITWLLGMLQTKTKTLENVYFAIVKALGTMLKQDAIESAAGDGIALRPEDESVLFQPDHRACGAI